MRHADADMKRKKAAGKKMSLSSFAEEIWLPEIRAERMSWATDERMARGFILPALGERALSGIGAEDILALMQGLRSEGRAVSTRNRILSVLRSMFGVARKKGLLGAGGSPAANIPNEALPRKSRKLLSPETLRRVMGALEQSEALEAKFLRLMLLTNTGKAELLRARWEDFSEERQALVLKRAGGGKERECLLSPEAVRIIKSLPRACGAGWLFPGSRPDRPMSDIYYFWNRLRSECGCPGLRLYDLQMSLVVCGIRSGAHTRALNELFGYSFTRQARRIAAGA